MIEEADSEGVSCSGGLPRVQATIEDVADEIVAERTKLPDNRHQLTALNEEVGELNQAMLEHQYGNVSASAVYREAVQVAAMAIRVATEGDHSFDYEPHAG